MAKKRKTKRVSGDVVDTSTGEILEDTNKLPDPSTLDRSKPLPQWMYDLISKLPDGEKNQYMDGFKSEDWNEEQRMKHYRSNHYDEVRYGPGKGTVSPPKKKGIR